MQALQVLLRSLIVFFIRLVKNIFRAMPVLRRLARALFRRFPVLKRFYLRFMSSIKNRLPWSTRRVADATQQCVPAKRMLSPRANVIYSDLKQVTHIMRDSKPSGNSVLPNKGSF
jgi:hypothetical protein